MINLSRLNKRQLIQIIEFYEYNLNILGVLLSDINNTNLEDVNLWLDNTTNIAEETYKNYFTRKNDKEKYQQLDMFI